MDAHHSEGAILTRGLRRALWGAIIVGCVLASVQIIAVSQLQREIDLWAWTSELNSLREELVTETQGVRGSDPDVEMMQVIAAFDDLRRTMREPAPHNGQAPFVSSVSELESEARRLFLESEERRIAIIPHEDYIKRSVGLLQNLATSWSEQIALEEQKILRDSDLIDARAREIADLRVALTSALLNAQLLQQQIIAIDRLSKASPIDITISSIATLDTSLLPAVCTQGEIETADRLCSPSTARVRKALSRLQDGPRSELSENIRLSVLGFESYIRAGQGRLQRLSEEDSQTLADARAVRQRLAGITDLSGALSRVDGILLTLKANLDRPKQSLTRLMIADQQLQIALPQIQRRMSELLGMSPILSGNVDEIVAATTLIADSWNFIRRFTHERMELLSAFEQTMERLSEEVAAHADSTKKEATLWVNVYVSNFVVLAGLSVAAVMGVIWLARRRLVTPLSQVTGTIVGLARGELEQPVVLSERAFGFETLGSALEQLRVEMSERHLLAKQNEAQQKEIESNLSDLRRTSEEMEWMAMHDPLTGLANRRQADQDLEILNEAQKSSGKNFCVMQIDIDRFKAVNDTLGHEAGDQVLNAVSLALMVTVAPDAKCYRTGGDEFLLIWQDDLPREEAARIAKSLIAQIKEPIEFNGHQCNVGASIGIAYGVDADFDAMRTVINADLALYQVKRDGRDGYKFFTKELACISTRQKDLSDRIIAAVEQRAFQPYYQPQYFAATRQLRGIEVLCRWHDDTLGWVAPGDFLDVAADLNIVDAIDEILFEKVAHDLNALAQQKTPVPRVSFNVTTERLLKPGLARDLTERIGAETTIALELLETTSLDNPTDTISHAIDALTDAGIEIEIDDFGSDRASLAGLMAVNPHAMKIDRSIVIPIVHSQRHRDLVKKIIDIGVALNVNVVAEGVETQSHADALTELGCDVLQGFGLAKPMPFDELASLLNGESDRHAPSVA